MQIQQIICDHCGKILYGKKGIADVHEDYIQIQGSSAFEQYNVLEGKYIYRFLFPTSREALAFCDVKCLSLYMQTAIERAENWMKNGTDYIVR
jgi:ribosomal protein L24E